MLDLIHQIADPDVADRADRPDRIEAQQAAPQPTPAKPHVAEGQHIVEEEIPRHRDDHRHGLRQLERQPGGNPPAKDRQMDEQPQ